MEEVTRAHREPQSVAVIRDECQMSALSERLGEIFPTVYAAVAAQGIAPTQPPFTRYLDMAEGTLRFEAGVPLAAPFADTATVVGETLPGGEVAVLWHIGPYDTLGDSHDRLHEWIAAQGRQPGDASWEVYWTDPGEEPDPARWRTEIVQPLLPLS